MRETLGILVKFFPLLIGYIAMAVYYDDWLGVAKAFLIVIAIAITIMIFVFCGDLIIKG